MDQERFNQLADDLTNEKFDCFDARFPGAPYTLLGHVDGFCSEPKMRQASSGSGCAKI